MKRLSIILVIFFIISMVPMSAFALTGVSVNKVIGSGVVGSGSSYIAPALVSVASGASKWIPLVIPGSPLISLIGSILVTGAVGYGIQALADKIFTPAHGAIVYNDGSIGYDVTSYDPPSGFPYTPQYFVGYYSTSTLTQAAVTAKLVAEHPGHDAQWTVWPGHYCGYKAYATYYWGCWSTPPPPTITFNPYTASGLATDIAAAGAAGDPKVAPLVGAAIDEMSKTIEGTSTTLEDKKEEIQTMLDGAVTQTQKDDITATDPATKAADEVTKQNTSQVTYEAVKAALQAQGLSGTAIQSAAAAIVTAISNIGSGGAEITPAQVQTAVETALANKGLTNTQIQAAVEAALVAKGLTKTEIQAAVKAAVNDESGVTVPTDPTIVMPEKSNLTTVMQAFVTSINNLPMFQTLQGLTINVSGSSTLCLNLPAGLGGNTCYNASNMSGALNTIGTAFLALTTLFSFVGIFRG